MSHCFGLLLFKDRYRLTKKSEDKEKKKRRGEGKIHRVRVEKLLQTDLATDVLPKKKHQRLRKARENRFVKRSDKKDPPKH